MRWPPTRPSCMTKEAQTGCSRAKECYASFCNKLCDFSTRIGELPHWEYLGLFVRLAEWLCMTSPPPPPTPTHILRSHTSPISALCISSNNERIYTGDASGTIVVTSTLTLRPIARWGAHKAGILGVEEWGRVIVTSVWRANPFFFVLA